MKMSRKISEFHEIHYVSRENVLVILIIFYSRTENTKPLWSKKSQHRNSNWSILQIFQDFSWLLTSFFVLLFAITTMFQPITSTAFLKCTICFFLNRWSFIFTCIVLLSAIDKFLTFFFSTATWDVYICYLLSATSLVKYQLL